MMKLFRKTEKGFSLVELMIVVAIIAILAAIAIPSFMRFAMKAKTSEAMGNLNAIKTCEESYRAEEDVYQVCTESPNLGGAVATSELKTWADEGAAGAKFEGIGFAPDGDVRYHYAVASTAVANTWTATAEGNIDGDGTNAVYTLIKGGAKPALTPPGEF